MVGVQESHSTIAAFRSTVTSIVAKQEGSASSTGILIDGLLGSYESIFQSG